MNLNYRNERRMSPRRPIEKNLIRSFTDTGNQSVSRHRLPTVGSYFRTLSIKLHHHNEWKKATCPFCGVKKALLIRPLGGAFKCTACGSKGNGLIKLHMELHGLTYEQAADQLATIAGRDHDSTNE